MDVTERVRQHAQATVKRDDCARRGIEHAQRGDIERAHDLMEQAEIWALRALILEPDNNI